MATDPLKKKLESLRTSISKLETQLVLAKGNKLMTDSINKMISRFQSDLKKLKE